MRTVLLAGTIAWLTLTPDLSAQVEPGDVRPGRRLRVAVTDSILRSPSARPGRLRRIIGTVVSIEPDTLRMATSPADPPIAIPRIRIYKIELSLGHDRRWAAGDAALVGGGIGAVSLGFFREKIQAAIFVGGYAVGALVGAVLNHERWVEAWLPE